MIPALVGGLLGLFAGALSIGSLWLITGFAARAAKGLKAPPQVERPTGWDVEAQDPDVLTAGQWLRIRQEATQSREGAEIAETPASEISSSEGSLRHATLRLLFAFLLKAPLLLLVALGAQRLGADALHWCVGGVILVYSLAVFWAAARTARR